MDRSPSVRPDPWGCDCDLRGHGTHRPTHRPGQRGAATLRELAAAFAVALPPDAAFSHVTAACCSGSHSPRPWRPRSLSTSCGRPGAVRSDGAGASATAGWRPARRFVSPAFRSSGRSTPGWTSARSCTVGSSSTTSSWQVTPWPTGRAGSRRWRPSSAGGQSSWQEGVGVRAVTGAPGCPLPMETRSRLMLSARDSRSRRSTAPCETGRESGSWRVTSCGVSSGWWASTRERTTRRERGGAQTRIEPGSPPTRTGPSSRCSPRTSIGRPVAAPPSGASPRPWGSTPVDSVSSERDLPMDRLPPRHVALTRGLRVTGQVSTMVVTTSVTEGRRGVEENPNRQGGSTGRSSPRSAPSKVPSSPVTARTSVAP